MLSAEALSSTNLEVKWLAPKESGSRSPRITGYMVQYEEMVISDCVVEQSSWSRKLVVAATVHRYGLTIFCRTVSGCVHRNS